MGIEQVRFEVLPAGKSEAVKQLQAGAEAWPWWATASTMRLPWRKPMSALGWEAAQMSPMEAADITLVRGDLYGVADASALSRATVRNIRQNLFFAFIYNMLGIPLAAGVFYPLTGWLLSPVVASLAIALSSVSVRTNALRLRSFKSSPTS